MSKFVIIRGGKYNGRKLNPGDVIDGPVKRTLISMGRVRQLAEAQEAPSQAAAQEATSQVAAPEPIDFGIDPEVMAEIAPAPEPKPVEEVRHFGRRRKGNQS